MAKHRGSVDFWASVLPDNRAMAGLFLAVGAVESKANVAGKRYFKISVDRVLKVREKFLKRKNIQFIDR